MAAKKVGFTTFNKNKNNKKLFLIHITHNYGVTIVGNTTS